MDCALSWPYKSVLPHSRLAAMLCHQSGTTPSKGCNLCHKSYCAGLLCNFCISCTITALFRLCHCHMYLKARSSPHTAWILLRRDIAYIILPSGPENSNSHQKSTEGQTCVHSIPPSRQDQACACPGKGESSQAHPFRVCPPCDVAIPWNTRRKREC